jgi:type III secretory pathway component EscR
MDVTQVRFLASSLMYTLIPVVDEVQFRSDAEKYQEREVNQLNSVCTYIKSTCRKFLWRYSG